MGAIGGQIACTVPRQSFRRTSAGASTYPYGVITSGSTTVCPGWLPAARADTSTSTGTCDWSGATGSHKLSLSFSPSLAEDRSRIFGLDHPQDPSMFLLQTHGAACPRRYVLDSRTAQERLEMGVPR